MKKEVRTVVYDDDLHIEAYRFEGIAQPFPNHFHEYYVVGFVEEGERALSCKNQEYTVKKGDILLFNPGDNHACVQSDEGALEYRSLNITKGVMLDLSEEVTGKRELPGFSQSMITDEEAACYLRPLHESVMKCDHGFGKEENLLILVSLLIQRYGQPFETCVPECRDEIEKACAFMEQHFAERIYLENVRIGEAKKLLEQGVPPVEAALQTGFSDQSGNEHLGIIEFPVPILRGSTEDIKAIREKLYQPEFMDLMVADLSDLAQGCKTYSEFIEKMGRVDESSLQYFGVAICDAKKKVNKLTGNLPLLR